MPADLSSPQAIVVSRESAASDEPYAIIQSNIDFINALFAGCLKGDEVSQQALLSYHVDYYLTQVNNGGFAQFVRNSGFNRRTIGNIRGGLAAMGATRHATVFEEGSALVEGYGEAWLADFLSRGIQAAYSETPNFDALEAISHRFFEVAKTEDLIRLNAAWLRAHPDLVVATGAEMTAEAERRSAALPDRAQRIAEREARAPRYVKLIRALCAAAGHRLQRVTAGDYRLHEGEQTLAWHFLTDHGHFHMVDAGGKALMFAGFSKTDVVCAIDAPA